MIKEISVLGFNFTKISGEKNSEFKGKLKATSNVNIENIKKQQMALMKEEPLMVEFRFDVKYEDLGNIEIIGDFLAILDKDATKEALDTWAKKKLSDDIHVTFLNLITNACTLRALQLEEQLTLPLHIQIPRFQKREDEKKQN